MTAPAREATGARSTSAAAPAGEFSARCADVLGSMGRHATGRQVWAGLGSAGVLGETYRAQSPAAGVDRARLGALLAAVDAHVGIGSTLAVCVQIASSLPLLAAAAAPGPARDMAAGAVAGEAVVAFGATDEATGSDLAALSTTLRLDAEEIEVTGTKRWITNATQCDAALVLARHRPGRHFTSFTWVLVPVAAAGVTVEAADTELFDGSGTGHIRLDRVRLPRSQVVGRPGMALASFAEHIAVERLAGALWGVALCRRVLADTKRRLAARPYGDGSLWHLEGVRQRFADALVLVRQLRALTAELGDRVAVHHDTTAAALLKSSAAATVERVLAECAQLQGAEGFAAGGIQHLRAQAALFGIGGGTRELMLSVVGDAADTVLAELAD
ncbi:acyl-CoA dehydrogenase domain-containing protein [Streptomyces lincolnensis]|uniref:Acyl-[acyl-carrier-protein] dehydrogenase MbtN n=1 Tax=Streptomyces lincolnensis TaxID=1915 RepID=A0A1B1MPK1_STRLN|nr:acyl-CoA dehydrogenase family protein [Streptomyces lincolnensis]ANS70540.1 acyl-CoA dehydrogenase domain-containing protein [Streptomyces lincolnensis]